LSTRPCEGNRMLIAGIIGLQIPQCLLWCR
jgi:hypothetical protein